MTTETRLRPAPLIGGLALVVIGGALLLDRLGVLDVDVWGTVRSLWPLIIVAIGVFMLIERRWIEGGAVTVIGVLLLGSTTGIGPDVGIEIVVPVIVVAIGLAILSGAFHRRTVSRERSSSAILGGSDREIDPSDGDDSAVTALFGGYEVRIRDRAPAPGAKLSAFAMFGGVDIYVPEGVPIRVTQRRAILGGVDVQVPEVGRDETAFEIEATAILGAVEVQHR